MNDLKKRDVELWNTWQGQPNKTTLTPLLKQVDPIIRKEVGRWSGGAVATPILMLQAKKLALQAFQTYNPEKAALNTHLTNQLKGLSREPYTYTSPARMPEHRQIKLKTFIDADERLKEGFGRDPTAQELASDLAWSFAEVSRFRKEMRREYSTSQPVPPGFESHSGDDDLVGFVYYDLNPQDKLAFEHTTGYGGAPVLDTKSMIGKTGLTQGQISHSKRRLKKIISSAAGMV